MAESSTFHHVSILIERPPQEVYDFVHRPENLGRWASGLGDALQCMDGLCLAQTPAGEVRIRFCDTNELGVLDHVVQGAGWQVYVPMRVVAAGQASLFTLTLLRQPQMSDIQFAEDIAWVQRDLATLKSLLERQTSFPGHS